MVENEHSTVGRPAAAFATRGASCCARLRPFLAGSQLVVAAVLIALEITWSRRAGWTLTALTIADAAVIVLFAARVMVRAVVSPATLREPWLLVTMAALSLLGLWSLRLGAAVVLLHDGWRGLIWLRRAQVVDVALARVGRHPARSLVVSFAGLILFGSFLLSLPVAARGVAPGYVNALFTSVSAVCVTGLNTLDPALAWSRFGQGVILVLIQLGGIGIMSLAAFMTLAVGRELGLRQDALLRGAYDEPSASEMRTLVKGIVLWTLTIEAAGAMVLLVRFATLMPFGRALAFSVFHSVSAFCNAGFTLFPNNLVAFATDPLVSLTIASLITLGGFGFGVLVAVSRRLVSRQRTRLGSHPRLVLVTSALLVWIGAIAYFLLEYDRSLAALTLLDKIVASVFHSVSARTAGFNTVDLSEIRPATALTLIVLMFIGASPASTGGGIKTTTFAVTCLCIYALVREQNEIRVFGRKVSASHAMRALALTGAALGMLIIGLGVLLLTETIDATALAFEATSALATVGLSMGVTPKLTTMGRLIVCALMFVGRVGPLTVIAAIGMPQPDVRLQLPEDRVLIG